MNRRRRRHSLPHRHRGSPSVVVVVAILVLLVLVVVVAIFVMIVRRPSSSLPAAQAPCRLPPSSSSLSSTCLLSCRRSANAVNLTLKCDRWRDCAPHEAHAARRGRALSVKTTSVAKAELFSATGRRGNAQNHAGFARASRTLRGPTQTTQNSPATLHGAIHPPAAACMRSPRVAFFGARLGVFKA